MAFPEKVTYNEKYNLRPIIEPDGQFSAEDANHIKEKINKNALFYGVHDNLAALQTKFPNPPVGAFAYIIDGSCYRCVNLGWTTDSGGSGSVYFKGYHPSMEALRLAHPNAVPGSRAIIKVIGANDKEALWDEDAQDWFSFEIAPAGVSQEYVDDADRELQSQIDSIKPAAATQIQSFIPTWISGLTYSIYAKWTFAGTSYEKTEEKTHAPADATYDRKDKYVLDFAGNIVILQGVPSANPIDPVVDPITQIDTGISIRITANATEPEGVSSQLIYDEAAAEEWTIQADAGINANSNVASYSGAISIEATNLLKNAKFKTIAPEPVINSGNAKITFRLKLKTTGAKRLYVMVLYHDAEGGFGVGWVYFPNYNSDTTDWQFLVGEVSSKASTIEQVWFSNHNDDAVGFGCFIDDIRLVMDDNKSITTDYATENYVDEKASETLQAAKDYADLIAVGGYTNIFKKSANFILEASQHKALIRVNSATAVVVTIPKGLPVGFEVTVKQAGTGAVSFVAATGVVIEIDASEIPEIASQHNATMISKEAADATNDFVGIYGGLKKAAV